MPITRGDPPRRSHRAIPRSKRHQEEFPRYRRISRQLNHAVYAHYRERHAYVPVGLAGPDGLRRRTEGGTRARRARHRRRGPPAARGGGAGARSRPRPGRAGAGRRAGQEPHRRPDQGPGVPRPADCRPRRQQGPGRSPGPPPGRQRRAAGPGRGPPARAAPDPGRPAARGRRRPGRPGAGGRRRRRRGGPGRPARRRLPPRRPAPGRPRPDRRHHDRPDGGRAGRPRRRGPRLGPGRGPRRAAGRAPGRGRRRPAGDRGDGQVRGPGAELRQRRRRDLRGRARRRADLGGGRPQRRHPAGGGNDPRLRAHHPRGRQRPLVRTLASHLAYYDRWAKTWEFQALLKARPAAGDRDLGERYAKAVAPLVWHASQRENFVEDVQAMRRRVVATLPKNMAGRELKLGPGGLRDIEFAVQLLQLVHGSADDRLRVPPPRPPPPPPAAGGSVVRADAYDLAQAYRFLRQTEHLLQIYQLRRTHTLPTDPAVLRRLGRAMRRSNSANPVFPNGPLVPPPAAPSPLARPQPGRVVPPGPAQPAPGASPDFRPPGSGAISGRSPPGLGPSPGARPSPPSSGAAATAPEEAFTQAWTRHAQQVRRLHQKLFHRPLLDAVAKLPSGAARLTPDAARARLEALGYRDPAGALRHIEALTSGLRRRAAIQRTLLPVLLGWFADAAEPDAGLLAFRQVSEALGETPWFLRLLRDETKAAERMACVLASSRYATGLLLRAPEAVALFADDAELVPKTVDALRAEMMAATRRHVAGLGPVDTSPGRTTAAGAAGAATQRARAADAEQAAVIIRSLRRRELFRVAASNVLGLIGLAETAEALTAITSATLDSVLTVSIAKIEREQRAPLPSRFAVIAMGRYGGHESGFGSDADVIFVHDPLPGLDPGGDRRASEAAQAVGTELRRLLSLPAPDPPLLVDADLRPEGRQGPLVRSLAASRAYYEGRAQPWEFQALLRAEFAVGRADLGAEFIALADQFRYPARLPDPAVREIRRIKARIEAERIPRGTDGGRHLTLGPG